MAVLDEEGESAPLNFNRRQSSRPARLSARRTRRAQGERRPPSLTIDSVVRTKLELDGASWTSPRDLIRSHVRGAPNDTPARSAAIMKNKLRAHITSRWANVPP